MSIEETDNTQEVLSAIERAIQRGLEAIGMTVERYAKEIITNTPAVNTGRLRNSIADALSEKTESNIKKPLAMNHFPAVNPKSFDMIKY